MLQLSPTPWRARTARLELAAALKPQLWRQALSAFQVIESKFTARREPVTRKAERPGVPRWKRSAKASAPDRRGASVGWGHPDSAAPQRGEPRPNLELRTLDDQIPYSGEYRMRGLWLTS